jgi:ABC-type branched-subunit amino acid transport system substrate-binding protein
MRHRFSSALIAVLLLAAGCQKAPPVPPAPKLASYSVPGALPQTPIGSNGMNSIGSSETIQSRTISPPVGAGGFVPGASFRVGLLLPLTGRSADLGRAMQDAATVSLFDKYARLSTAQTNIKVELLPKDTGDTPEQAAAAMNAALAEGASFIIGPLFGDATEAAAPIAQARNISVLSLSNKTAISGHGIYMFGFSPQDQTTRVVDYALSVGKTRIAAMVPDSPLGNTVLEAARATLARQGLALVKEVKYSPQGVGLDIACNKLADNGTPPDFDALLLPEGGAPLGTILRSLNARGVSSRNVQLLGTGIWDDASLVRRVPLEGAWLASSPPADSTLFDSRFRATYNYGPPRIASLAYDAVALAVTIATSGRPFDLPTLTSPAGFSGPANGIFRLRPDGKVERGLAVLQVQAGAFKVLSPAPMGFVPAP